MKKSVKSILTVLFAAVLFMSFGLEKAEAAPADNTAYLAYSDSDWGECQYWGEPTEGSGVVGTNAEITGLGQYTVSVDFTGTANGKAKDIVFAAPIIQGGTTTLPGHIITIDSIVVNGSEIEFTKGYANDEDGGLRSNIYNAWVGSIPADARTVDGSLDGASPVIVDPELFVDVETVAVTFTLSDADGNTGSAEVEAVVESAPKTGVTSMALVYGLGVLVTGALVLKKKEK